MHKFAEEENTGTSDSSIASHLVTCYFSVAVLTGDAIARTECAREIFYHQYVSQRLDMGAPQLASDPFDTVLITRESANKLHVASPAALPVLDVDSIRRDFPALKSVVEPADNQIQLVTRSLLTRRPAPFGCSRSDRSVSGEADEAKLQPKAERFGKV